MGRRKGGRNKGYYYRKDRGWYTSDGIPLEYPDGRRMRKKSIPQADLKAAYSRATKRSAAPSILEVSTEYLNSIKTPSTYETRSRTLFDFCYGLPGRFINNGKEPKPEDKIHKGYAELPADQLTKLDVTRWLQAHDWNGSRRTHIQAVKKALNHAVDIGLLEANPIKGYKTPKQNGRVTYITPEQEQALIEVANPALATAIKVLIRTGARPGCEFAALTAKHVTDSDQMLWTFEKEEGKNRRLRVIYIQDPEIIEFVRERLDLKGPIFRNSKGTPWKRNTLSRAFSRAKEKTGIEFDKDACLYSCRHTYAKRILQGYWSGQNQNIETLAKLMDNSPQVCRDHYLQWTDTYDQPLWDAVK